jgi:hypothetical protein
MFLITHICRWIAVDGRVYDITEHLLHHPDWQTAGGSSYVTGRKETAM